MAGQSPSVAPGARAVPVELSATEMKMKVHFNNLRMAKEQEATAKARQQQIITEMERTVHEKPLQRVLEQHNALAKSCPWYRADHSPNCRGECLLEVRNTISQTLFGNLFQADRSKAISFAKFFFDSHLGILNFSTGPVPVQLKPLGCHPSRPRTTKNNETKDSGKVRQREPEKSPLAATCWACGAEYQEIKANEDETPEQYQLRLFRCPRSDCRARRKLIPSTKQSEPHEPHWNWRLVTQPENTRKNDKNNSDSSSHSSSTDDGEDDDAPAAKVFADDRNTANNKDANDNNNNLEALSSVRVGAQRGMQCGCATDKGPYLPNWLRMSCVSSSSCTRQTWSCPCRGERIPRTQTSTLEHES
jgi:hypothetical protein